MTYWSTDFCVDDTPPGTNSSPTDSSKKVDIKFNDKYG
jgi:hypothetical protein